VTVKSNIGWTDARYTDYLTDIDGVPTQLAGDRQAFDAVAACRGRSPVCAVTRLARR
jgi:hypothetical protein